MKTKKRHDLVVDFMVATLLAMFLQPATALADTGVDPLTGRCTWKDPRSGELLVCPATFPNCSQYEGICYYYDYSAQSVEACRFAYTEYLHITRRCEDFQTPAATEPPPVQTQPQLPPEPITDSRLTCRSGWRLSVFDPAGNLLRSEELGSVRLGGDPAGVRYHVACDQFATEIDGLYRFSVLARETAALYLDDEEVLEVSGSPAGQDRVDQVEMLLIKGSHRLELLSDQYSGPTALTLGWTLTEEQQCPGSDLPLPLAYLPWEDGVVHRVQAMRTDNRELGLVLSEQRVDAMELRQRPAEELGLAHQFEGTVAVAEKGVYHLEVVTSGDVEVTLDGQVEHSLTFLGQREALTKQIAVRLAPGRHTVQVLFKPTSECILLGAAFSGPGSEDEIRTICGAAAPGQHLSWWGLMLLALGLGLAWNRSRLDIHE